MIFSDKRMKKCPNKLENRAIRFIIQIERSIGRAFFINNPLSSLLHKID